MSALDCVVIGGGGFIGTNLCRHLRDRVARLRAFGRSKGFAAALDGIDWINGDLADTIAVANAVEGADVVFHLASTSTPASSNVDPAADLVGSVRNSLNLLEACRAAGVGRVVFASSGGTVYGIPELIPTPESASTQPITAYGITKLAVEKYLYLYEYLYGLEYRVLRIANPYGPYQLALKSQGVVAAFLRRALHHQPLEIWGDGRVTRDYIFIDDVVAAFERAATHEGTGRIFNIGSGQGLDLNGIVAAIAQLLGRQPQVRYLPPRRVDVPVSVLDVRLAARELGWQPQTPFAQGLAKTAEWLSALDRS
ncbi:MAG: NAD-dependent epimerase/dehydratase family protein [Rhodocyclaceae bacterium]